MTYVRIRGQDVDIDIEAELQAFEWTRPDWRGGKLKAASPFRYDKTPSFFVNLDGELAGVWADAGAYDAEWRSGNFAKLLAFLRQETYGEAEEYLLDNYGMPEAVGEKLTLRIPKLAIVPWTKPPLREEILAGYEPGPSDYLRGRAISDEVQREAGVLYHTRQKAVVLPWRTATGKLANVKYRKIHGKAFWYETGGVPIRELVYGIDRAARMTVLCEAEIDALSWRTAGFAAVAVGGVAFNRTKRDLIIRSPIEELIIATDNDKAGEKLRAEVAKELNGYVRVRQAYIVGTCKDANEALVKYGEGALKSAVEQASIHQSMYFRIGRA